MGFTTLDYFIVAAYLVGIAVLGLLSGGRQTSSREYFLGRKNIPWWAVCFAIVATETSTLTFISIPGLAYATNLNFLQLTFGYLLGRVAISVLLLPEYAKGDLVTAYQLLGLRFGPRMRNTASVTFMGTRLLADGVRLYATAIPLTLLLRGWQQFADVPSEQVYILSIILLAGMTLVYTSLGGVRAVIWTDVLQMFIYLGGAIGAAIVILNSTGFPTLPPEKLSIIRTGLDLPWRDFFGTPYTLPASLLGGAFLSMASHGTDQIIVQRLLTVGTLSGSRKALIGSGVIVIAQFGIFLAIGGLLYGYYGGASLQELGLQKGDEIFPKFIIEQVPTGLSGLIIAGLLAAAMSTLSGSINSLASATMTDIYQPYFAKPESAGIELRLSRLASLFWCVLLVGVAIFFIANTSTFLVELALSIASVTYGGMLGVFLLAILFERANETDAIIGFILGILVMAYLFVATTVAWTWFTFIGTSTTMIAGIAHSLLFGSRRSADTQQP